MASNTRRDWKAITLDYAAMSGYDDDDTILICLTQRQVAVLKALLMTAYWSTRWANLSISAEALNLEVSNIDSQLDGNDCECSMISFRDNPLDPCEVQYSHDDGETWVTMFRKDNCSQGSSTSDITNVNNTKIIITENNETWDNDIVNIAPDWAYESPDTDNALCWAIDFYIDAVCAAAIATIQSGNEERRDSNDWWQEVANIFATAAVAASAIIGLPAAAAGAVAWAAVEIADSIWDDLMTREYDQFEDEAAKDLVKCCMWMALHGETAQWEDWLSSLDDCDAVTANEIAVWEQVSIWNANTDIYINYMLLVEDINSISFGLLGLYFSR